MPSASSRNPFDLPYSEVTFTTNSVVSYFQHPKKGSPNNCPKSFFSPSCRIKGSTEGDGDFLSPKNDFPKFSEASKKKLHDLGSFHPLKTNHLRKGRNDFPPNKNLKNPKFFFSDQKTLYEKVREFQVATLFFLGSLQTKILFPNLFQVIQSARFIL